ncbi:MAG: hypothetical protein ACLTDX_16325 [[Clostridium] innocuum]
MPMRCILLLMMEGDMTAQEIEAVCADGMDGKPAEASDSGLAA